MLADKDYENIGKDYELSQNWFVPGRPQWQRLITELSDRPINVLEIGVFEGRSSIWILENLFNHADSRLITIDTFEGAIEHTSGICQVELKHLETKFRANIERTRKGHQVSVMKGHSYENLIILNSKESGVRFDLIYIDGSHNAEDVLADAILSWRLLKENGILIFDDYGLERYKEPYNNPRIAIDSFLNCHAFEIEVLHENYQLAIRKVGKGKDRAYTVFKLLPADEIFFKI